jgi:Family of unknown function (DUF5686)/CarboxypepD_reg-like domain
MRQIIPLFVLIIISTITQAQKIQGIVTNKNGELLTYSSITIKGTTKGVSANDKGKYELPLNNGTYTLICQHIGYTKLEKEITIGSENMVVNFVLEPQKLNQQVVTIKANREDPAYEMIRKTIRKRDFYNDQVKGYSSNLYTKDVIKLINLPSKILGKKVDKKEANTNMKLDSSGKGIIYLSESLNKMYTQKPDKFKMQVLSSRISGSNSFGFSFPTFISFYKNNVKVFADAFNPRGFISPISDNALSYYKYKYEGSFTEDGKEINTITVTPRRKYEPLFSGTINIVEDEWRIHSVDFFITKNNQLEIMDTLKVYQVYGQANSEVWMPKNQILQFNFNQFGLKVGGSFVNIFSDYTINPTYEKKFFDRVLIKYDTGVNKRTVAYWDSTRPMALEADEKKDYKVKDSLFSIEKDKRNSKEYIDSMNKLRSKIKPLNIFTKGIHRYKFNKTGSARWNIEPLLQNAEYNTVEGWVVNVNGDYKRYLPKSKINILLEPNLRYGFNNSHFNGWLHLNLSNDNEGHQHNFSIAGGKRVSQFNSESTISPQRHTASVLLWGNNYMKIYENYFGQFNYAKKYDNGIKFNIGALYEDRIPLDNTTDYVRNKQRAGRFTPNYPVEQLAEQFDPHQALIVNAEISIKPGQRYIQFPRSKMSLGSKYPTFSLNYSKGVANVLGSDVDFDKWRFSIQDDKNLKLAGTFKYRIGVGGFINNKKVFIQDYQHFNGNQSLLATPYMNSFQLASFFENSTKAPFYAFGHVEHHFNGLLTNKIPLLNRLKWNLVAGANTFYVNQNNNYVEAFVGLENIFKVLRIDFVTSYSNGGRTQTGIRLGLGGLIGSSIANGLTPDKRNTTKHY